MPLYNVLTLKTDAQIYGVEIQKEPFELGLKSIKKTVWLNKLSCIMMILKYSRNIFFNQF